MVLPFVVVVVVCRIHPKGLWDLADLNMIVTWGNKFNIKWCAQFY